jgi:uncharacterized protein YkwD
VNNPLLQSPFARRVAHRPLTSNRLALALLATIASASPLAQPRGATPSQVYSQGDPIPEEQYMLQLVNRARSNPTAEAAHYGIDLNEGLNPGTISSLPKQPLAFNPHLLQSSRGHSQWMLANDQFTHFEGVLDPGARMTNAGFVFSGSWAWGENIAWRGTTGPLPAVVSFVAQEYQDLFVDSQEPGRGHRLNILNPSFREIGIGIETGVFAQSGHNYNTVMITQDLAESDADKGPFLVGVVYRDSNADGFYSVGEGTQGVTVMPAVGTYYAVSSSSGGFAIPISGLSGTLQVTFSQGPLAFPVTKSIALTGQNLELDFELNRDARIPILFVAPSLRLGATGQFTADLTGPTNTQVTVQTSSDLKSWAPAGRVTLTGGTGHFVHTPPPGSSRLFYRAVVP